MLGSDFAHAWDESECEYFAHARSQVFAWRGPYVSVEEISTHYG